MPRRPRQPSRGEGHVLLSTARIVRINLKNLEWFIFEISGFYPVQHDTRAGWV